MKKALNALILLAMIAFIVVQYNDPDGFLWALVYFYGTVMAANALRNKYDVPLLIMGLVLCVVSAILMLPAQWTMWITNEIAREVGGLGVTALFLAILLIQALTQEDKHETPTPEPAEA